jgi:hypothetical protein
MHACILNNWIHLLLIMSYKTFRLTNNEIRRYLLEILYNFAQKDTKAHFPAVSREQIQEILKISEAELNFNMVYLDQKGLVKLHRGASPDWYSAQITVFGIDVLQNKDKYSEQFPFIQTTIQQIYGDVYGTVAQAVESQVNFDQQVTSAFKQARDMTKAKEDIPPKLMEEIEKNLDLLEEELKSKEPDAGKIQKLWKWLKRNANWVVPTVTQVVLEGMKVALG